MRLYLEYILSIRRSSKLATRRQLRTGFATTTTEILLASFIMLIAVMIAGNGLVNLMRNNHKANADSDLRNSLNRALELMGNEVRRAKTIATSTDSIADKWKKDGKTPILAFNIADPDDPTRTISEPIVYYVQKSDKWNNSSGSTVLWRYGPPLDSEGNYKDLENTGQWNQTMLALGLVGDLVNPDDLDCDPYRNYGSSEEWQKTWDRIPPPPEGSSDVAPGMYACIRKNADSDKTGNQVALFAKAEAKLTAAPGAPTSITLGTKASAPAQNTNFIIAQDTNTKNKRIRPLPTPTPTPGFEIRDKDTNRGNDDGLTRIITTKEVDVTAKVLKGKESCEKNSAGCYHEAVKIDSSDSDYDTLQSIDKALTKVKAGYDIIVTVGDVYSIAGNVEGYQKVDIYTNKTGVPSSILSRNLTEDEILIVMTNQTTDEEFLVLLTIKPST